MEFMASDEQKIVDSGVILMSNANLMTQESTKLTTKRDKNVLSLHSVQNLDNRGLVGEPKQTIFRIGRPW